MGMQVPVLGQDQKKAGIAAMGKTAKQILLPKGSQIASDLVCHGSKIILQGLAGEGSRGGGIQIVEAGKLKGGSVYTSGLMNH